MKELKAEDKLALIVDCENEIAELKNRIDKPYAKRHPGHAKYLYSMLKRQEIALLALTAPPAPVMQPVRLPAVQVATIGRDQLKVYAAGPLESALIAQGLKVEE